MKPPPLVAAWVRGGWTAPNYRGRPVSRLGGPAFVGAAVVATAVAGAPIMPVLSAAAGALMAGRIDDLWGSDASRGLLGHLGLLRRGRMTTGTAKIVLLSITGTATAITARRADALGQSGAAGGSARDSARNSALDMAAVAGCVALGANLANLFDLRPGRALKVVLAASLPASGTGRAGGPVLTGIAAAAIACLPADLAERTMLGDAGANPAGALTGLGLALVAGPRGRQALLAGMVILTLSSEVMSFSRVIGAAAPIRWLDDLGRYEPA